MPPVRVIPSLDPRKHSQSCFGLRLPNPPVDQLALQRGKETFSHRIVISIADRPHARAYTHFLAAFAKRHTGVLAALV